MLDQIILNFSRVLDNTYSKYFTESIQYRVSDFKKYK